MSTLIETKLLSLKPSNNSDNPEKGVTEGSENDDVNKKVKQVTDSEWREGDWESRHQEVDRYGI